MTSENEKTEDILDEMCMDYTFALHNLGEKFGQYITRLKKANDRCMAALRIATAQHDERKRLHEIAKTAIREVQDRIIYDGIGGPTKEWWEILEKGFLGTYRNDYNTTSGEEARHMAKVQDEEAALHAMVNITAEEARNIVRAIVEEGTKE